MRVEDDKDVLAVCRSLERFEPSEMFVRRVVVRCREREAERRRAVRSAVWAPAAAALLLLALTVGLWRPSAGGTSTAETALVTAFLEDQRDMVESFAENPDMAKAFGLFVLFHDYARSWDETLPTESIRRSYRRMVEGLEGG